MTDDDQDEWLDYASAGYGGAIDPWEDLVPIDESEESDIELDDEDDFEDDTPSLRDMEAPPCPAPMGIRHIIRLGSCDHCLARIGGRLNEGGLPTHEHGARIRADAIERDSMLSEISTDYCPFCEDLFDDIQNIVVRILRETEGVEFNSLQMGYHISKELVEEEDYLRKRFGARGAPPLKASFAAAVELALKEKMKEVNLVKEVPDVMILVDSLTLRVKAEVRPVFLYGRYRKMSRDVPQTRWPCRSCKGRKGGCESCEMTGLQYRHSVQDLVGEPIRQSLEAGDTSFHGMGREDIDVRCLGRGRPFVIEVKQPKKRTLDIEELLKSIAVGAEGLVEVDELRQSTRPEVARIKETKAEKSYRIRFEIEGDPIDQDDAEQRILSLSGAMLEQRTPKRVAHRRSDLVRKRELVSIENVVVEDKEIQFDVRCQTGTYVKEMVHSDDGRTTPSVAEVLERACEVLWLDVLEIHAE
jgi:tRNA pseudouridine synthase 10